jgi:replicative DNA helicase
MAVTSQEPTVPPQDLDAEESVLGAMLVSGNAVAIVSELLQPDDFYRRSHATIYQTILEMYGRGENVDTITLTNALSNRGLLDEVGGKAVVHTLAATVPAVANARHYA